MAQNPNRLELLSNLAIIGVSVLLAFVLMRRTLLHTPADPVNPAPTAHSIGLGTKLWLPDVDWRKNGRTLIIALMRNCRYCSEAAPFYQRLSRELNQRVRFIIIVQDSLGAPKDYVKKLGLSPDEIREAPLTKMGVNAVPTVILADEDGWVKDIWVGHQTSDAEQSILERLRKDTNSDRDSGEIRQLDSKIVGEEITPKKLKEELTAKAKLTILDVRDRKWFSIAHIIGARNIPIDELAVRGPKELDLSVDTVTYCDCTGDHFAEYARELLVARGFRRVVILRGKLSDWKQIGVPIVFAK